MRYSVLLLAAILGAAPVAAAEPVKAATPDAAASAEAKQPKYTVTDTVIGTLLDDPAAKAILEKHIPGMTTNDQVELARAMTLKDIQAFAPDEVTDERLAAIDAELAKL